MSLASYIGWNVEIPLTDPDSNDVIVFGPCFSDESMLEIETMWGIELDEWQTEREKKEAKKAISFMRDYGKVFK